MLDKTFDPAAAEARIYAAWDASGAFQPSGDGAPFCIVIPPPNVTGSLHIGHALNNTLQDILARYMRMRGRRVLWQPGTDHAGIATQMVVERQMAAAQEPDRRTIGREAFLEKVWAWKAESGGTILNQLKRLGASCDWSRERFTMDEGLSAAVRKVFVQLYREGLIYRDKRLVNWDPKFETAISDLEVENIEVNGHFWRLRYPLADGVTYQHPVACDDEGQPTALETRDYIVVATTRPETMLGDTAVAVHPDDPRYASLVGTFVDLPLTGRKIPIIADEHADPSQGSGAVKITPAHDFNDFAVGKRHDLPMLNILSTTAQIADDSEADGAGIPAALRGLDRFEARRRIVGAFAMGGLLDGIEDRTIMTPHGDRSHVVIEPRLTDQWYVDAKILAAPALAAVRDGKTRFVPESWAKTYFNWLENIEPWCISRQLWWGHRIPAWYDADGRAFVADTEEEAAAQARAATGDAASPLRRDEDVLDTWFSSGLWPFSTLGWPEDTEELKTFYPTSVLVTGFDIIFFWVARMMMMGLHFQKEVPFHDVYIHALVRDEHGAKMSKSKGNVIDPLELVDEFGADALRFTLAALAAQGRDIKMSKARVEGYRNFGTKVWNAARFAEMNGCAPRADFDPATCTLQVNRWIVGEVAETAAAVSAAIEGYRFNEAAGSIYRFAWNTYCDWYLELVKPIFLGPDGPGKDETRAAAAWAFDQLLKLLHPFSPFITEELWAQTAGPEGRPQHLIVTPWPAPPTSLVDPAAKAELSWLVDLVSDIRSVRADINVPAAAKARLVVVAPDAETLRRLEVHRDALERLARLEGVAAADVAPRGAVQIVVGGMVYALPLGGLVDLGAEKTRLAKELGKTAAEIERLVKKLSNEKFVANAAEEVVAAEREKQAEYEAQQSKLQAALARIEEAA